MVLMEAIKMIAYATDYNRLLPLIKSGAIGKVIPVAATCTSLMGHYNPHNLKGILSSITT